MDQNAARHIDAAGAVRYRVCEDAGGAGARLAVPGWVGG